MRARHRVSKLLLRQGLVWDHSAWTAAHEQWLREHHFQRRGIQLAYDEALDAVLATHARRDRLDVAITEMALEPEFAGPVGRLCCLRGVSTLLLLITLGGSGWLIWFHLLPDNDAAPAWQWLALRLLVGSVIALALSVPAFLFAQKRLMAQRRGDIPFGDAVPKE